MKRYLVLEDGSRYEGEACGSDQYRIGELVFNTAVTGYQELLTDSSCCGQIVTMTYPLMGNVGINRDDRESVTPSVFGLVMRDLNEDPSNFRSEETLDSYLKRMNIPGIYEIDTREITRKIRTSGTMKASFCDTEEDIEALVKRLGESEDLRRPAAQVSARNIYTVPGNGHKVVLIDCGCRLSLIRELSRRGFDITVVPYDTDAEMILGMNPDGVVIAGGPGDPQELKETEKCVGTLIAHKPVFGIGLGCQLIARACGASTYRMKFGHRGANHPVISLKTGKAEITLQNHGWAIDAESLKDTRLQMTHRELNDRTCEGIRHLDRPCFGVQYFPEAAPKPTDSGYLFDSFAEMMEG